MKVFRIETDIDKYQVILPVSDSDEVLDLLDFVGHPKKEKWQPIEFYIDNPLQLKSDFISLINSSACVCTKKAVDNFYWFWEKSAELLPIYLDDGTELFIINVIDCVNALDINKTEHYFYDDGSRSNRIKKYEFHKTRLHDSSIFKIPQTANSEILTYTGLKATEDEFYTSYANSKLKGLIFEEVYSDE